MSGWLTITVYVLCFCDKSMYLYFEYFIAIKTAQVINIVPEGGIGHVSKKINIVGVYDLPLPSHH